MDNFIVNWYNQNRKMIWIVVLKIKLKFITRKRDLYEIFQ